ncbi:sugar phosphate isomerase/epimerase [bacterium]|nr:sugar phosphate isomerase/epimerase [bacterium]
MKFAFIAENDLPTMEADAQFAGDHGFAGLEFNYWGNFTDLTEDTVRQMRALLDRTGIRCAMLGLWGWNHLSPNVDERTAALAQLQRAIDFAKILEADVFTAGGGEMPDATPEENADEFAEVFPPYIEQVRDAGMAMAVYPLHGNSFFHTIDDFRRVWDKGIDVGIKMDCANFQHAGQRYLPILRDHGDRIAYVHIKEHVYMDGELASQPAAGMGDIEWGKIMAFLHEAGYDGYLSIEPHGPLWGKPPLREKMILLSQRHISQFLV